MRVLAASLALATAACAGGPPVTGDPWLEAGTGVDAFESVVDGQELPVITGNQGGYHLWGAARTGGLEPRSCDLLCTLDFVDTGKNISVSADRRLLRSADDAYVATGLICFIDARTVEAVRGQRVVLTITARDIRARSASDRRTVVAR